MLGMRFIAVADGAIVKCATINHSSQKSIFRSFPFIRVKNLLADAQDLRRDF